MEKPKITINLDKHLHDFLYHEFKTDECGAFILTKRSDICLYIDSMWVVSDRPVKKNGDGESGYVHSSTFRHQPSNTS